MLEVGKKEELIHLYAQASSRPCSGCKSWTRHSNKILPQWDMEEMQEGVPFWIGPSYESLAQS